MFIGLKPGRELARAQRQGRAGRTEAVDPRCDYCKAPMPKDRGAWIVAPVTVGETATGVLLLCSRECDRQHSQACGDARLFEMGRG